MPVLVFLAIIIIAVIISCIKVVPQANAYVIERLGTYAGTWLHCSRINICLAIIVI